MKWHAWYRGKQWSAQQIGSKLSKEQQEWREFWDQILSGLAWSG